MIRIYTFLIFLSSLFVWSFESLGKHTICLERDVTSVELGKFICILEDSSKKLSIEEVVSRKNTSGFKSSRESNPSFGITESAYWVHFKIKNNLPGHENWLLQGPSIMDKMDVYFSGDGVNFKRKTGGWLTPILSRDYENRKVLFQLPLDEYPDNFEVYIRFETQRQMAFPMTLWSSDAFSQSDRMEMYVMGIYFGILLVMVFYNTFIFFSLKDKSYLYYVLYITCFGLAQFFEHGFAIEFFGDWIAPYSKHIHLFLNTLTLIVAINFSRKFLNSGKQTPKLDKLLVGFMMVACIILTFISIDKISWALLFGNFLIICSIITLLAVSFVCLKNGYRPVRYFLIGWFALMCGIVLYILKTLGVAPYNFFTVYSMQIASAFEVVLFSLALADRINEIKREQEEYKDNLNKELEFKVIERTHEIVFQKEIIEQKNKDITDSINYAQRIQQAILPLKEDVWKTLPESFILYSPRDIVSGDFYWYSEIGKDTVSGIAERGPHVMVAACDCTGHGVPGAFMSMIGTSQLHKIINEKGITVPGLILNELNEGVRQALKQDKEDAENRDGMDIALCSISFTPVLSSSPEERPVVATLQYAGAFRPLFLVRDGILQEVKADKFPIGGHQGEASKKFTNHTIPVYKDDTIYIFTDGYIDQFGGDDGRKFMTKRFKEELLKIQPFTMSEQEKVLKNKIDIWMDQREQVDDILIIGIRF